MVPVIMHNHLFTKDSNFNMKHIKFLTKCLGLSLVITYFLYITTLLVTPKHYDEWNSTSTFNGFYQMPKNSVDVIFLGSSHAVSFFSPQEIYNNTGVKSYNLGCEQQNLLASYYWLQEALKYQTPKVVVLETYFLYPYTIGEETPVVNFHEGSLRKAFDFMRPSLNKLKAVRDICTIDSSQRMEDYLFPMLKYHTRWKELSELDFTILSHSNKYNPLKGYVFFSNVSNYEFYGYEVTGSTEIETMVNTMEMFLDKITALCSEKGIELILVTTPSNQWSEQRHNRVSTYAEDNSIDYIDFCSPEMIRCINYTFTSDNADYGHGNAKGAANISKYIAEYIIQSTPVSGSFDSQWETGGIDYNQRYQECLNNIEINMHAE